MGAAKKRRTSGFGSDAQPAREAADARWEAQFVDAHVGADSVDSADSAGSARQTRRQSLGEDAPSPVYAAAHKGELLWSEYDGHTKPGEALQRAVAQVWKVIDKVANPYNSGHANIAIRRDELICALLDQEEVQATLVRQGRPTVAHQLVADGVAHKLCQMRDAQVHKGEYGRVAYNAVMMAAVAKVEERPEVRRTEIARVLQVHRSTLYLALGRAEKLCDMGNGIVILDPVRARRKDATSLADIASVQNFWAAATRPSPDAKPLAVLRSVAGEKVQHGIHWQEYTTAELFERFSADPDSPSIGRELFRLNRPYFVRKPQWRGSLCPKCHVFRLLREGLIELIEQCVAECNTCTCSFCTTHNAAAAEAKAKSTASVPVNYPPQSSEKLWEAMFCPKQAAPADSGFIGTLPCYELGCQMKYLQGKQMAFIDGTGNNPALLDPVPQPCDKCASRFPLAPPEDCAFIANTTAEVKYMHYVKTPRLGRTDATDREDLQEVSVSRRDFLDSFNAHLSTTLVHKYVADNQAAVSDIITTRQRDASLLLGFDFAMNHTAVPREELKQEFWDRTQVSLHPMLAYHEWFPNYADVTHPGGKPRAPKMMQTHMFLSDDPKHDTAFVDSNMRDVMPIFHLQRSKAGIAPLQHVMLLSDNGPAHYKNARSFYNMSVLKSEGMLLPAGSVEAAAVVLEWMFLAPDHGKSNWDGISGITKNMLADGELRRKKGELPLINAERCAEYLRSRNRKKQAGFELHPFPVRASSTCAVEINEQHLTEHKKLQDARLQMKEAKGCAGSNSHYHLRFISRGQLQMRWLGCPCAPCEVQADKDCKNRGRLGCWADRKVELTDTAGVARLQQSRKIWAERIAEEVEIGDVIATWTEDDVCDWRQYWLGVVTHAPIHVAQTEGLTCEGNGQHFHGPRGDSPGEHVLRVRWLDRVTLAKKHDCVFHELHDTQYWVHASTLRMGKVKLETAPPERASARTMASTNSSQRARYVLPAGQHAAIAAAIGEKFQDES